VWSMDVNDHRTANANEFGSRLTRCSVAVWPGIAQSGHAHARVHSDSTPPRAVVRVALKQTALKLPSSAGTMYHCEEHVPASNGDARHGP
jgi:hypothetical protein